MQGALTLARYCVARISHFYDLWSQNGCPKPYCFSAEDIGAFREPAEFTEFLDNVYWGLKDVQKKRVDDVRALKPLGAGTH